MNQNAFYNPIPDWALFFVSAAFVVAAGVLIGRISGELGERLGLGRAWAGAVLLSIVTTLPELVTTLTVTLRGAYGLALGGILGSVIFNLFILVLVDIVDPAPLYHRLSKNHLATGLLGAALLGTVMVALSLGQAQSHNLLRFNARILIMAPLALIILYGVGQYVLFRMAKQTTEKEMKVQTPFSRMSFGSLISFYIFIAGVIVVAARGLGISSDRLTEHYDLAATFAGATMLGIVTSLPEITNAVACSRQREYDLAVGNILGANSFVLVVLAIAALLVGNQLFTSISFHDAISTLFMAGLAVVMQAVALGAMAVESEHRLRRMSVVSFILASLYATSLYVSYHFSGKGSVQ